MKKKYLEMLFDQEFKDRVHSKKNFTLNSIDPDLIEFFVLGVLSYSTKNVVWICNENLNLEESRQKLENWLNFFNLNEIDICSHFLPFDDPYINNAIEESKLEEKTKLIKALQNHDGKKILITTLSALNLKIEEPEILQTTFIKFHIQDKIERDQLIGEALDYNYKLKDFIQKKGDLSYRGSIVDIFPIGNADPIRIEIEDDRIQSIRLFDLDTQRSLRKIRNFTLFRNRYFDSFDDIFEYLEGEDQTTLTNILDIFPDYELVIFNQAEILDEYKTLQTMFNEFFLLRDKKDQKIPRFNLNFTITQLKQRTINLNSSIYDKDDTFADIRSIKPGISHLMDSKISFLHKKIDDGYTIVFFDYSRESLIDISPNFLPYEYYDYPLPYSFEIKKYRLLFWSRTIPQISPERISSDLPEADDTLNSYLGKIKGEICWFIGNMGLADSGELNDWIFSKAASDFFKIEYKHSEYLYIPVYESDVLTLYSAFSSGLPALDKLGGKSWGQKKKRAKKNIQEFAKNLLDLYSKRKSIKGKNYIKQVELEEPCEKEFKYILTRDQEQAIKEVLDDLQRDYPMDRLICGDVGFGKTEVAIRAALRVVTNDMQVALLTPTTILAYQHFKTFTQRFKSIPIRIKMISRLVKKKAQDQVLADLKNGKVDILIGTHALLADRVSFSNLGLYILDEEQRFGVFQKEKLKEKREDIDVLTMTATPIPRTLSLSMADISDISVIRTPPIGRIAVKNYIGYFMKSIIISAVTRELSREGQVFIIYNNISKIFSFKEKLQEWLKGVKMGVIHAKMSNQQVEQNLIDFINKKFSILVSTTIIENGIDISNVNTLLVIGAENFGLTQLYQLRGRIGRSSRQAYAFFLLSKKILTQKAQLRLEGIKEFVDLGAGYEIAKYDYRLRGAGSLLGNRQHGHIEALGFDYYNEMLQNSLKEIKGEKAQIRTPKITVSFVTQLDSLKFLNPGLRIRLYKKILDAENFEELKVIREELIDRYGSLPLEIDKILYIGLARILAREINALEVILSLDQINFNIDQESLLPSNLEERLNIEVNTDHLIININNINEFIQQLI